MGLNHGWRGPDIVRDGLVLYLDAGSPNSYQGTGTVWKDISKVNQNNGTLVNGPTFSSANGGSIVFDGVDDRVSRNISLDTGQNFTACAWIYPTLLGTTRRAVIGNGYPFSGRQGWLLCTAGFGTNNTFFMSIGNDIVYNVADANTLSLNTWQYITTSVTNGGETIRLYKNGVETSYSRTLLGSGTITYNNNQFYIGFRDTNTNDPYTGNISNVQIYNRALTATEVLQNYNATKGRFGL